MGKLGKRKILGESQLLHAKWLSPIFPHDIGFRGLFVFPSKLVERDILGFPLVLG